MNQTVFNVITGAVGATLTFAFGTWSELLTFFLIAVVVDIGTGIGASIAEGKGVSSAVGYVGLAKKAFMFVAILLAHRMDVLMGTSVIMNGAIYAYLANELVSIAENYGRVGLPMPEGIKRVISVLKDRGESK